MSKESTSEDVLQKIDTKVIIEVLTRKMGRMLRAEMESIHERLDQIENTHVEQPQNAPRMHRRERIPRRVVRVDDDESKGGDFEEEDDLASVVSNRRYGGRFREARNRGKK
ncbi:uncharacterized protein A4U43_C04F28270 [Asparagus officinalis]|uniref:Uncharacterized protein n=1 Tax=Asparagus officinalis TaxID=4686 RepID=A0A5P1F492_ASPOF|nr:uncharacterized protein A4U43_C04F28270 [Asparagus officinalis]